MENLTQVMPVACSWQPSTVSQMNSWQQKQTALSVCLQIRRRGMRWRQADSVCIFEVERLNTLVL